MKSSDVYIFLVDHLLPKKLKMWVLFREMALYTFENSSEVVGEIKAMDLLNFSLRRYS